MSKSKISITEVRINDAQQNAVLEVLRSGMLREGKLVRDFEEAVKLRTGVKHAIATSSGTAALHLANLALLQPGDEVLVPTFTFIATASMVQLVGARPIFCDIDSETWTLSIKDIENAVTPKTKAIIPVHLFGNICGVSGLQDFASKNKLSLIWDAAQAFGGRFQNQDVANLADLACYSFYPSKNMTTGEGGMITTNNEALASKIRLLKAHGQSGNYAHEIIGLNYRMSEMEAAIGLGQLKAFDSWLARRTEIAGVYTEAFKSLPQLQLQKTTPESSHAHNYYSLALNLESVKCSRDVFIKQLHERGVPCAVHYPTSLHQQPCFLDLKSRSLPVSEDLSQRIFSLPLHPYLDEASVERIVTEVKNALQLVNHVVRE